MLPLTQKSGSLATEESSHEIYRSQLKCSDELAAGNSPFISQLRADTQHTVGLVTHRMR
jgi:hypothetical protein